MPPEPQPNPEPVNPIPENPETSPSNEDKNIFSRMDDVLSITDEITRDLGSDSYEIIENQQQKAWMDTSWKISDYTENVNPVLFDYANELEGINAQYLQREIMKRAVTDVLKIAAESVIGNIILPGTGLVGVITDTFSFANVSNIMLNIFTDKSLWKLYIKQLFVSQCLENFRLNYQQAEEIMKVHSEGLDPQRALQVAELYKTGSEFLAIASYFSSDAINYYNQDNKLSTSAEYYAKTFLKAALSDLSSYEQAEQFSSDFIEGVIRKVTNTKNKVYKTPDSLVKAIDVISDANKIAWAVKDETEDFMGKAKKFKNDVTSAYKLISIIKVWQSDRSSVLVEAFGIRGIRDCVNDNPFIKIPNDIIATLKGQ